MKEYLIIANSIKILQEYTDDLLMNYNILKRAYSDLTINWNVLYLISLYHNLEKINLKFQNEIITKKYSDKKILCEILGLSFFYAKN